MKDIERIQSTELAVQVQDANPGNFAIEQEVAQLVGATVPAPTEPSADDARELGAQLLVFLRRALLPIQTALRTALAAIYAHLDSRCTAYTPAAYDPFRLPAGPYDPMRPFVPRTLPNLLTALTAFADRKISGVPEAADGISLVHLLHASAVYNTITELKDNTSGWTLSKTFQKSLFPNLTKLALGCKTATIPIVQDMPDLEELDLPNLEGTFNIIISGTNKVKRLYLPNVGTCTCDVNNGWAPISSTEIEELICGITNLTSTYHHAVIRDCSTIKRLILPNFELGYYQSLFYNCPNLEYIEVPNTVSIANIPYDGNNISNLPNLHTFISKALRQNSYSGTNYNSFANCPNLIHLEVGDGLNESTNISGWNPTNVLADADKTATFLQNFRDHIALRLTANGSGLTLTLSQAVRDAIHAAEATYGIEAIIVTQKGWTLSPAPTA